MQLINIFLLIIVCSPKPQNDPVLNAVSSWTRSNIEADAANGHNSTEGKETHIRVRVYLFDSEVDEPAPRAVVRGAGELDELHAGRLRQIESLPVRRPRRAHHLQGAVEDARPGAVRRVVRRQ